MKNLQITEKRKLKKSELNYIVKKFKMKDIDQYRRFPNVSEINLSSDMLEDDRRPTWLAQQEMYNGLDSSTTWDTFSRLAITMLPLLLLYQRYSPIKEVADSIELKAVILTMYLVSIDDYNVELPYDIIPEEVKHNGIKQHIISQIKEYGLKCFADIFYSLWF